MRVRGITEAPTLQNSGTPCCAPRWRSLDRVLDCPAYNYIIHTTPIAEIRPQDYYHWHMEIMPKLTKVAGFEWGTGFYINPTPPEESARFLRDAGLG